MLPIIHNLPSLELPIFMFPELPIVHYTEIRHHSFFTHDPTLYLVNSQPLPILALISYTQYKIWFCLDLAIILLIIYLK